MQGTATHITPLIECADSNGGRRELAQFFRTHMPGVRTARLISPRQQQDARTLAWSFGIWSGANCIAGLHAQTPTALVSGVASRYRDANLTHVLKAASLERLAVHPKYRRQGLGRALVTAFEREARIVGVTHVHGLTFDASPFYESLGYTVAPEGESRLSFEFELGSRLSSRLPTGTPDALLMEIVRESDLDRFLLKQIGSASPGMNVRLGSAASSRFNFRLSV